MPGGQVIQLNYPLGTETYSNSTSFSRGKLQTERPPSAEMTKTPLKSSLSETDKQTYATIFSAQTLQQSTRKFLTQNLAVSSPLCPRRLLAHKQWHA